MVSSKRILHVTQQFLHFVKQMLPIQWLYSKYPLPRVAIEQGQKEDLVNFKLAMLYEG